MITLCRFAFGREIEAQNFHLKTNFDMKNETTINYQTPPDAKRLLGDALSQLVIKIDKLIKDEEQYNPEQLDESSWSYQVGILITANEAKLLLKMWTK